MGLTRRKWGFPCSVREVRQRQPSFAQSVTHTSGGCLRRRFGRTGSRGLQGKVPAYGCGVRGMPATAPGRAHTRDPTPPPAPPRPQTGNPGHGGPVASRPRSRRAPPSVGARRCQ